MKLEKTKKLAGIYNSITQELKAKGCNFNVNAATFNNAEGEFFEELDGNILKVNKDLIISRFEKYFDEYYPYFDMNDFDDERAELLSEYKGFNDILDCLLTFEGLQEYKDIVMKDQRENAIKANSTNQINNTTSKKEPQQTLHFTRSFTTTERKNLFDGLVSGGFLPQETNEAHFKFVFGGAAIPNDEKTFKRLEWIKTNSKTKGITLNKKSLLDLLCILGVPDDEIKNKPLLNELFCFPIGAKLDRNNYTDITDIKGNLNKPIVSEYHNELLKIVNQSKEK